YSINLEICSITRAELGALVTGLQISWERGYRRVRVQLDSRVAIQLLMGMERSPTITLLRLSVSVRC
ncbi:hypothetical protein LINGRAHAP2_LOCUS21367, partial [Linum grandiflorum]